MTINKATLAKEVDGRIEVVYPKTTADMVEYDDKQTVEQKIQSIDRNIETVDHRVTTLATGVSEGSVSTLNDLELFDIRNPNTDVVGEDVEYQSAGEAVRGQIGKLSDEIADTVGELYKGYYYEEITVNGEILCTSDEENSEPIALKTTLSDLAAPGIEAMASKLTQRILDSTSAAIRLCKEYTDKSLENALALQTW